MNYTKTTSKTNLNMIKYKKIHPCNNKGESEKYVQWGRINRDTNI
jgi:hypothetical protein